MSDEQIKYMVNRFLGWKLPENFSPDGGIHFTPTYRGVGGKAMAHEPVGTNLFDAGQAEVMIRYLVEDVSEASTTGTEEDTNEHTASHISDSDAKQEEAIDRILKSKAEIDWRGIDDPKEAHAEAKAAIQSLLAEARINELDKLQRKDMMANYPVIDTYIDTRLAELAALGGKSDE